MGWFGRDGMGACVMMHEYELFFFKLGLRSGWYIWCE
jgi:hypothetical protein